MSRPKRITGPSVLATLVALLLPLPVYAQEETANETCLGCHDGVDQTLRFGPHVLTPARANRPALECRSCHSGAEVHVNDPSAENVGNPAKLSDKAAFEACSKCHVAHQELDNYGFDVHAVQQLNCASCHQVHNATTSLKDAAGEFCWGCHRENKAAFLKRSNHPVNQNVLTCLSCHKFAKRSSNNLAYDLGRLCQDCHPDQAGPHPYEHAAAAAYTVEGGGCIECHNPHGSEHDALLRQTGNNLCKQCHSVPTHQNAHNGAYANLDCMTCHTDIHGSLYNARLLDVTLSARFGTGCYCHTPIR